MSQLAYLDVKGLNGKTKKKCKMRLGLDWTHEVEPVLRVISIKYLNDESEKSLHSS